MISSSRIEPGVLGHLLSQHRELHARLLLLRAAFDSPRGPGSAGLEALRCRLRGLREYLAGHFAQEESGGHLEESIARMPRLSAAARAVVAEHPDLLAELDALLQRLSVRDLRHDVWREAAAGFATFTDHLLDHERNENAVLQQGYNEDFGFPE
jgi:hypothetical protein